MKKLIGAARRMNLKLPLENLMGGQVSKEQSCVALSSDIVANKSILCLQICCVQCHTVFARDIVQADEHLSSISRRPHSSSQSDSGLSAKQKLFTPVQHFFSAILEQGCRYVSVCLQHSARVLPAGWILYERS